MTTQTKTTLFTITTVLTTVLAIACGGAEGADTTDGGVAADANSCTQPNDCVYPSPEFSVLVREGYSVVDPVTGRELPILMRIPDGEGPYPVVIWSHGGAFNDTGHRLGGEWGTQIASQGYIVVHPAHVAPTTGTDIAALCNVANVPVNECMEADEALLTIGRTTDLVAVLNDLQGIANLVNMAGGAADTSRVVVAGWSGGSQAPLTLMGAVRYISASAPRFMMNDGRPLTTIAISPPGSGFSGFFTDGDETSWDSVRGPNLIITGENDIKPTNTGLIGTIRREAWENQPSDGQRRLLYSLLPSDVGSHSTFALDDIASSDSRLQRLSLALHSIVRAFLDEHVKQDAAASAYLASDTPKRLAGPSDWLIR